VWLRRNVRQLTANGQTPLDWCYPITNPATFFPTTLAIAPNGDPTETVSVTASVQALTVLAA